MGKAISGWRRAAQAAAAFALVGLVAACGGGPPAPVELGDTAVAPGAEAFPPTGAPIAPISTPIAPRPLPPPIAMGAARPPAASPVAPVRPQSGVTIVVRPGQSLGGLAEQYHVAKHDIVAANHLQPPYGIEIGQRLVIPGNGGRAELAATAPPPPLAGHAAERAAPEIIPLDGPAPMRAAAQPLAAAAPRIDLSAAATPPSQPPAPRPQQLPRNDGLLWPVQGRVLAGYGAAASGRRNDGINIAASLGTPICAVDGGSVAYVGNEVPGYGNLVLIRHPDGFISAYAHCEKLLVRKGEHVARGQVIAKVGATGGVAQPQLHFELRRGEQAVDPRQFLAPRPSAEGAAARSG